jgi:hypothetical protein
MQKKTLAKLAGFGLALTCTGGLVAYAAGSTGAYFTDSHPGSINASIGSVKVNIAPGDGQLNFTGLLPGVDQSKTIDFQTTGSSVEDIWIVFDADATGHTNKSEAFTGLTSDAQPGPLGRYGHLKITSNWGANFESTNLSNPPGAVDPSALCYISPTGQGGEDQQLTSVDDKTIPYCAPHATELADNVPAFGTGQATITFGYSKLARDFQQSTVGYKIVATQHGVRPDDPFNPTSTTQF